MRILGIDYGDSKIGVAVSDLMGWTAQGLETIKYNKINDVLERIKQIIDEYNVDKIIVGMPKNMNGTIGFRGEKTFEFIEKLKTIFTKDIETWDERLSTKAAQNVLIDANVSRKKRKKVEDTIAATFILQGYLDFNNK